jgi:hypothetical protein
MRKMLTMAALAVLAPVAAVAQTAPGQYQIQGDGVQEICLQADGTWYGTTFPDWGGTWRAGKKVTLIHGNYAGGDGNDAMTFKRINGLNRGNWQEWRDNLSFDTYSRDARLTAVKTDCDPPGTESAKRNPLE